jgi:Family of unknown function (DUF6338)
MPDPEDWITQGHSYVAQHPELIAAACALELVIALGAAKVVGSLVGQKQHRRRLKVRAQSEFYLMNPLEAREYIRVQLKNGVTYSGFLDTEAGDRSAKHELILAPPLTMETREDGLVSLEDWTSMILSVEEVSAISISYRLDEDIVVDDLSTLAIVYRLDDGTLITGAPADETLHSDDMARLTHDDKEGRLGRTAQYGGRRRPRTAAINKE